MNYRHIFHAGNFADVFKHIVLSLLFKALKRKDKAFCYLDTHAGSGIYNLYSEAAQKTQEFNNGIGRIMGLTDIPPLITEYVSIIRELNTQNNLQFYPGSPLIAQALLREQDKMILCELHQTTVDQLKQNLWRDKRVAIHHQDGYQSLKAFLPPKEKRGLVLIDPPFERNDEYENIIKLLKQALQRWENGIYVIWYPIKDKNNVKRFLYHLKNLTVKNLLNTELQVYPEDIILRLTGCGIAIINAPWQLDKQIHALMPWLTKILAIEGPGSWHMEWLIEDNH